MGDGVEVRGFVRLRWGGRVWDGAGNTGYTRWTLQGLSRRKAGNLKEVGLGRINGSRKDQGFRWAKMLDGSEQLF